MKLTSLAAMTTALLSVTLVGCNKEPSASSELERATKTMQKSEPATPAAAAPGPVVPPSQMVQRDGQPVAVAQPPAQQMNQAMADYKGGNYVDAVTRLQNMRRQSAMTPEQRMALQDAMAAVMTEIYGLAAKGDTRAQQAVKDYERMQTGR